MDERRQARDALSRRTLLTAGVGSAAALTLSACSAGSKRPAQTVTPLAARLGLALETTWKKDDTAALAAALRTTTGCTLVAWEHELIPDILSHLGSIDPPPARRVAGGSIRPGVVPQPRGCRGVAVHAGAAAASGRGPSRDRVSDNGRRGG